VKNQKGNAAFGLMLILLWITMAVGWVMNIVDLFGEAAGAITALFVLRIVGIFVFPLGAILGFFT
jgi:hypothetical protein